MSFSKGYNSYLNIFEFAKYRKATPLSNPLSIEQYTENIRNGFVPVALRNENNNLLWIIFRNPNNLSSKTDDLRGIIDFIKKQKEHESEGKIQIIIISKKDFQARAQETVFSEYKDQFDILTVRMSRFATIPDRGPNCGKHRILSKDEITSIINCSAINPAMLPRLQLDDPQCFWIGAKMGDIVEVICHDLIVGKHRRLFRVGGVPRLVIEEGDAAEPEEKRVNQAVLAADVETDDIVDDPVD